MPTSLGTQSTPLIASLIAFAPTTSVLNYRHLRITEFILLKATATGLTIRKQRAPPLVTLGDAVSSFLEVPDPSTQEICVASKADILKGAWRERGTPKVYPMVQRFWFRAASWKRWLSCNTFPNRERLLSEFAAGRLVIPLPNPQRTFTSMANADEWSRLAHEWKSLLIFSRSGGQRSNYYLQLFYTYSLPLLAMSGTLHWLVSQCISLARVAFYTRDGQEDPLGSISTTGYSCIAIAFATIVGFVTVLVGIAMGFRRYPAGIPSAAGYSAAISAACLPSA
ncbi:hypothetical protein FGG08_004393 [Glutinoglossum americanum]|uniref:Uncharacterized protein n=1 Tax=Glutinoglossum americanum TaxID=1670608 RepID=A0A9P8I578_9PEZI|nr:hypothetical protein FGG08_004393 [Glutinoglossum americanum]